MENEKDLLEKLIKRNEELKPIVFKSFDTRQELRKYKERKKDIFTEYFNNLEQIQQLKWELMTPEEQEREKEVLRLMKEKREGKMH